MWLGHWPKDRGRDDPCHSDYRSVDGKHEKVNNPKGRDYSIMTPADQLVIGDNSLDILTKLARLGDDPRMRSTSIWQRSNKNSDKGVDYFVYSAHPINKNIITNYYARGKDDHRHLNLNSGEIR